MRRVPMMERLVTAYLTTRRSMGFDLGIAGRQLLAFARFADQAGHRGPLTVALAVRWAQSARRGSRLTWARRLQTLHPFMKYRAQFDPATEIVPPGPLRSRPASARAPHLYRGGDRRLTRRGGPAAVGRGASAASTHVRHLVWVARQHRIADFRGPRARPHGRGPAGRVPHGAEDEVSEITPRPVASHHGHGLNALCGCPSASRQRSGHPDILRLRSGNAPGRSHGAPNVCEPPRPPRVDRPGRLSLASHP